jgi:hypothetical protein
MFLFSAGRSSMHSSIRLGRLVGNGEPGGFPVHVGRVLQCLQHRHPRPRWSRLMSSSVPLRREAAPRLPSRPGRIVASALTHSQAAAVRARLRSARSRRRGDRSGSRPVAGWRQLARCAPVPGSDGALVLGVSGIRFLSPLVAPASGEVPGPAQGTSIVPLSASRAAGHDRGQPWRPAPPWRGQRYSGLMTEVQIGHPAEV